MKACSFWSIYFYINAASSSSSENEEECSLFLAESGIPKAGFGVYTTKGYEKGSLVSSDMTIHLPDVLRHLGENAEFIRWTHDDYVWLGDFESEYVLSEDIDVNSFPMGALTNYHTYLTNIYPTGDGYDDSYHSRDKDPGVGAYSYSTRLFTATRDIHAGEELFTNYGEKWLDDHNLDEVPRLAHFHQAGRILKEMETAGLNEESSDMTPHHMDSIAKIVSYFDKRTASLLPKTMPELKDANVDKLAWKTITTRRMDWIKENGKCLDNIYPDRSTIPQAGRGAFSQRNIRAGELITPIPLLQIMNKTNFTMYASTVDEHEETVRNEEEIVGRHLLLNYCFTHKDSSLLLCPSTYGALINHDSQNPNAKYQWSSSWDATTKKWLQMSYREIEEEFSKGLSLDIIATRDIKPGEEIFFDYGKEWETAWNNHVESYTPDFKQQTTSSFLMNAQTHPIRTISELLTNPYPSNIMTVCYYREDEPLDNTGSDYESIIQPFMSDYDDDNTLLENFQFQKNINPSLTSTQFIESFSIPFDDIEDVDDNSTTGRSYWPCKAFEETAHDSDKPTYTVRIYQNPVYEDTDWTAEKTYKFVTKYPREFIQYVNRPYLSDMFLENAFRHPIFIHDDLFPSAWKNIIS